MPNRQQRANRKVRRTVEFTGGPKDGRQTVHSTGGEKPEFNEAYKRTKDVTRPEGMSDEDYAAKQDKYKTRRATRSRRLLKHTYGKNWGKRVYTGKASSAKYRKSTAERFSNLKGREEKISTKLSEATEDAQKTALQKKLDAVTSKRKEVGSSVREFRGQRREALQAAYDNPSAAQKKYPKIRSFSVSGSGRGKLQPRRRNKRAEKVRGSIS